MSEEKDDSNCSPREDAVQASSGKDMKHRGKKKKKSAVSRLANKKQNEPNPAATTTGIENVPGPTDSERQDVVKAPHSKRVKETEKRAQTDIDSKETLIDATPNENEPLNSVEPAIADTSKRPKPNIKPRNSKENKLREKRFLPENVNPCISNSVAEVGIIRNGAKERCASSPNLTQEGNSANAQGKCFIVKSCISESSSEDDTDRVKEERERKGEDAIGEMSNKNILPNGRPMFHLLGNKSSLGHFSQSVDTGMMKHDSSTSESFSPRSVFSEGCGGDADSRFSYQSSFSSCNTQNNTNSVSIQEARQRSFLVGSSHVRSLLGIEELKCYVPDRKLAVFVATWNMHEEKSVPDDLDDLLLPTTIDILPDIYVIGTQETLPGTRRMWDVKIQETIGPSHILLSSVNNGTLHLALFIKRDLSWFCSIAESDLVVTRAVSAIKTKGAVALCLTVFGTSLLFINSHLAAGEERNHERVGDYLKIISQLKLPKSEMVAPGRKYQELSQSTNKHKDISTQFDYTFWCGDLNFRLIKKRMSVECQVEALLTEEQPDYDRILSADQLRQLVSSNIAFKGFHEGHIHFPPTYKYDLLSDRFDTSKKGRVPSYTDRVLYRSRVKSSISCVHYDSVSSIRHSDHRPVYGVFEINIRPGRDAKVNLCAGQFCRDIFIEALANRAKKKGMKGGPSLSSLS